MFPPAVFEIQTCMECLQDSSTTVHYRVFCSSKEACSYLQCYPCTLDAYDRAYVHNPDTDIKIRCHLCNEDTTECFKSALIKYDEFLEEASEPVKDK